MDGNWSFHEKTNLQQSKKKNGNVFYRTKRRRTNITTGLENQLRWRFQTSPQNIRILLYTTSFAYVGKICQNVEIVSDGSLLTGPCNSRGSQNFEDLWVERWGKENEKYRDWIRCLQNTSQSLVLFSERHAGRGRCPFDGSGKLRKDSAFFSSYRPDCKKYIR